ncbi:hypothetical protein IJ135_00195, partial [Candidatus Saccharibacteria bacterium]|nr:hypothetical protein [Candidatus Saccharibacteria bacterium]
MKNTNFKSFANVLAAAAIVMGSGVFVPAFAYADTSDLTDNIVIMDETDNSDSSNTDTDTDNASDT